MISSRQIRHDPPWLRQSETGRREFAYLEDGLLMGMVFIKVANMNLIDLEKGDLTKLGWCKKSDFAYIYT